MKKLLLEIQGKITKTGLVIKVKNRSFVIAFPQKIWRKTPENLKKVLRDNLVFANTHWLPLIFETKAVSYNTDFPLLESFLFRNQLGDLLFSEQVDKVPFLSYLRSFYNLEFQFSRHQSNFLEEKDFFKLKKGQDVAVLPFTLGKESLVSLGLCQELGIKPILVYCQEPIQLYEEKYKKKRLKQLKKEYAIDYHFIVNEPGLFREDKAFGLKPGTELGWGTQTTILALLCLPFVYSHRANYLFLGSEFSNNDYELVKNWKRWDSYDQTSFWTTQQNNIVRLLTGNRTQLKATLEPLEEIQVFYILHHRYSKLSQYQFSCFASRKLFRGSQWCHQCYKCSRMFLFAVALGINPKSIGFKEDILQKPGMFDHYFGKKIVTGSNKELDFAFWLASKRGYSSPYVKLFEKNKLPYLKSWPWYLKDFTEVRKPLNLPQKYQSRILKIFREEMKDFAKTISL